MHTYFFTQKLPNLYFFRVQYSTLTNLVIELSVPTQSTQVTQVWHPLEVLLVKWFPQPTVASHKVECKKCVVWFVNVMQAIGRSVLQECSCEGFYDFRRLLYEGASCSLSSPLQGGCVPFRTLKSPPPPPGE